MKALVFDTGPIISFASNNLLWLLEELKKRFNGEFYICEAAKRELVDRPLLTRRFQFEALQVAQLLNNGTLKVIDNKNLEEKTLELLELANNSFRAKNNPIRIVHYTELSGVAACYYLGVNNFVIDERTTRFLIEKPELLREILQHKLHTNINTDKEGINKLGGQLRGIRIIRSSELAAVAFELGLLDKYLSNIKNFAHIENPKKVLLESVLWGVKLNGCTISEREIDEIVKMES